MFALGRRRVLRESGSKSGREQRSDESSNSKFHDVPPSPHLVGAVPARTMSDQSLAVEDTDAAA
jgi:hypothetical protein